MQEHDTAKYHERQLAGEARVVRHRDTLNLAAENTNEVITGDRIQQKSKELKHMYNRHEEDERPKDIRQRVKRNPHTDQLQEEIVVVSPSTARGTWQNCFFSLPDGPKGKPKVTPRRSHTPFGEPGTRDARTAITKETHQKRQKEAFNTVSATSAVSGSAPTLLT